MFQRFLGSQRAVHGQLFFGDVSAESLAQEFGTPLYVFDERLFREKCQEFMAAAPHAHISYASKANSAVAVLNIAREEGLSVDAASLGELEAALRAGFSPKSITLHGSNKSVAELDRACELSVGRVVVDCLEEVDRLSDIGRPIDVMIRLAPGVDPDTHEAISTGNEDTKFGFNIADGSAEQALGAVMSPASLHLVGYHCHIGSQLMNGESHVAAARRVADFAIVSAVPIEEICLGGGLGVPYLQDDKVEPTASFVRRVTEAAEEPFQRAGKPPPRMGFEPGRALVAEAGTTLYRVGARKQVGQRTYLSVDGGLADNPRPQLYGARYAAFNASRLANPHNMEFRVAGRHCETDTLIPSTFLPESTIHGDLIAIQCTGAYNLAMASNYNRYPRPAMVLVGGPKAILAVRRESLDDLFRNEVLKVPSMP